MYYTQILHDTLQNTAERMGRGRRYNEDSPVLAANSVLLRCSCPRTDVCIQHNTGPGLGRIVCLFLFCFFVETDRRSLEFTWDYKERDQSNSFEEEPAWQSYAP